MDWTDEPATWKQLRDLKRCGYQADRRLTKIEAANLISSYGGGSDPVVAMQNGVTIRAYELRLAVEQAKREGTERGRMDPAKMGMALAERQNFWLNTFHGTSQLQSGCTQVLELYRRQGCLFFEPTRKQVQDILDALDAAMPHWDNDHPELFYEAMELNFPELRKQGGLKR
jgi:hypothetical protein